jgi:hypothetical protein
MPYIPAPEPDPTYATDPYSSPTKQGDPSALNPYEARKVGVNLLGQEQLRPLREGTDPLAQIGNIAEYARYGVGKGLDLLFNVWDTPNRIMQEEVAKARLNNAIAFGDNKVAQKYIDMVTKDDLSLSEAADQMYKDGVATTGGTGHDLLVSIFLDPMNWLAPAAFSGVRAVRKTSGILNEMTDAARQDIMGRVKTMRTLTPDEEKLMNNRLSRPVAEAYNRVGRGLSGAKKAFAQAFFGRSSSNILVAIGINPLLKMLNLADARNAGVIADSALARASAHTMRGAAASYLVEQSLVRNVQAVNARVEAVNGATAITDQLARDRFLSASRLDERSAALTDEQILTQFDRLFELRMRGGNQWARRTKERLLSQAMASELGPLYGGDQSRLINSLDDSIVNNEEAIKRQIAVVMGRETDKSALILDQGIEFATNHIASKLDFMLQREDVVRLVEDTIAAAGKNPVAQRKAMLELLNAAGFMHLGHAAGALGDDLKTLRELAKSNAFLESLPMDIRTIVRSQIDRLSIADMRTMTTGDRDSLLSAIGIAETFEDKRKIILDAIKSYDNLGAEFQQIGNADATLISEETVGVVEDMLKNMDNLPESVPVEWTKVMANVPAYQGVYSTAARMGYKMIFEPIGVVSLRRFKQIDTGARTAVRSAGTNLWVPLTDDGMDVVLHPKTTLGRIVDKAFQERTTIKIMQNTLDRMYEYVSKEAFKFAGVPVGSISRNLIKELHSVIMDHAFAEKGSMRTVAMQLEGRGDSIASGILKRLEDRAIALGPEAHQEFNVLVHNGVLQDMIFYASRGDTWLVGLPQAFTGAVKHFLYAPPPSVPFGKKVQSIGRVVTKWSDYWYPAQKFSSSPLFWAQEIVESKFFNRLRGVMPETKFDLFGNEIRFGSKKTYEVLDPVTGEKVKISAMETIQQYANANRPELKYTQEMALLTHYLGYKQTEAMLSSSAVADVFVESMRRDKGWWAKLTGGGAEAVGRVKADEFWLLTTEQSLNMAAETLPRLMQQHMPGQWDLWLEAAGGDARGAALLMLHKAAMTRGSRAVVADYLREIAPSGFGFGRKFDDDPIKILRSAVKEARRGVKSGRYTQSATELADRLVRVRSLAKAIGYSDEAVAVLDNAVRDLRAISPDMQISAAKMSSIDESLKAVGEQLTKEFTDAVTRRKAVQDILHQSGIDKNMASEMASLFTVAERRGEMLPELSLAIEDLVSAGKGVSPQTIDAIKDHLMALREFHAGEQTVINALMDGIENIIQKESMRVHFYNTNRSFVERSLNHVFFSLYPTSYMFGKVLPEYMRLLFNTRRGDAIGKVVYAPQGLLGAVLKHASGGKFQPKMWSQFTPLVGFSAMYKVRRDIIRELGGEEDLAKYNPLMFLLLQIMVPGIPTDLTVSMNPAVTEPVGEAVKTFADTQDPQAAAAKGLQTLGYQLGELPRRTSGLVSLGTQTLKIGTQLLNQPQDPIDVIGGVLDNTLSQLQRIILNK